MELKNPLLLPNKWLQRTSSQNQVLAVLTVLKLNLSKKQKYPSQGIRWVQELGSLNVMPW